MLPTRFFKDPDVMALSSGDVRLILVGLVLCADDEGRELAYPKLLGRELDYAPEHIEQALRELEANDLLTLYQVGRHRYYSLPRWHEWETLSKPTPSKYPAPPSASSQGTPAFPQNPQGNLGESRAIPPEGEEEKEEEENRNEGEGEAEAPPNIVAFPAARSGSGTAALSETKVLEATQHVAGILKLTVTPALTRIVQEYLYEPAVSLLGEADAAREYIDDSRRNHKGQRMTPAFFRRWLKRERDDSQRRHAHLPTGTTGPGAPASASGRQGSGAGPPASSLGSPDPYRAFVEQRMQELSATMKGDTHAATS
jgi:DNA-binding transcriptional ArsR family regulator